MSEVLSESPSLGLDRYLVILKRHRWVAATATGLGIGIALGYLFLQPQLTTATTVVKVNVISSAPFNPQRSESGLLDAQTEQQMVRSSAVLGAAARELGEDVSTGDLRQSLTATLLPEASVMRITYAADGAEAARQGADAIAEAYLQYRTTTADTKRTTILDQLNARQEVLRQSVLEANGVVAETKPGSPERAQAIADRQVLASELDAIATDLNSLTSLDTTGGSILTSAADTPTYLSPSRPLVIATGLLAGLALGLMGAFLVSVVDRRVHDGYDIRGAQAGALFADVTGLDATIPAEGADLDAIESARERLLATFDPRGGVLAVLDLTRGGVPSDLPVNLALALSDAHDGVDLVLPAWPADTVAAVVTALGGERKRLSSGRVPLRDGRLSVVVSPGGSAGDGGAAMRLLQSARDAREPGRALVVAVPPQAPSSLRLAAGRMSDSTVLVAEKLATRIGELARLATELRAVDTVVRGTVLVSHHRELAATAADGTARPVVPAVKGRS